MIGKTVSHYEITAELGGGAMGRVYKATDTRLHREVALKFLPIDLTRDPDAKKRFIQEAQAASAIDHNNICTVYGIEETQDGQLYISLAYCAGETLKKKITRGRLDVSEATGIALEAAKGLGKAHQSHIVHRDVKPANIMITTEGVVKIVDFGIAKLAGGTRITRTDAIIGTAAYMSPEQARGDPVDHRTDIWSLGVVLYEMLTGRLPFRGDNIHVLLNAIQNVDQKPATELVPDLPDELDTIVGKCLAKEKNARYQTMAELGNVLMRHLGIAPSLAPPISRPHGMLRHLKIVFRYHWLPLFVIAVAAVMLLAFAENRRAFKRWLGIPTPPDKGAVILPFACVGRDSTDVAFCDGLVKELTSRLSLLEQFDSDYWIAPARTVARMELSSPRDAEGSLGGNLAVAGSYNRHGEVIRLTVMQYELHAGQATAKGTQTFHDNLTNLATWQEDVCVHLAKTLGLRITPRVRDLISAGGTTVPEAFELYLQGCGFAHPYQDRQKDLDAAISCFQRAVALDSSYALALAGLGETMWRRAGSQDSTTIAEAIAVCERSIMIDEWAVQPLITRGEIAAFHDEHAEAIGFYRRALALNPVSMEALRDLGDIYSGLGQQVMAEELFQKMVEAHPTYPMAHNSLGLFFYTQARYDEAVRELQMVVSLAPGYAKGFTNLGVFYFFLERWFEAQSAFEQSLAIEPTLKAYANLGTLFFYTARFADAAVMYEKAMEYGQDNYQIWGNLATCYYWTHEPRQLISETYAEAIRRAEDILESDPHDELLLASLAGYHLRLGDRERGAAYLEQLLVRDVVNVDTNFLIAEIYEQLGERGSALHWLERAVAGGLSLVRIERYPGLKELRADPRYHQIVKNQ